MHTDITPAPIAHTTRRQILAAAPLSAAVFAFPAVAAATEIPANRTAWNAAMAKLDRVIAEDAAFTPGWWARWNECKAACERIPHVTVSTSAANCNYSTADVWSVRMARHEVQMMDAGKMWIDPKYPDVVERFAQQRQLAEAADERDGAIRAIRDGFGMDADDEEAERLGEALAEAEGALMELPAPDRVALRWKLDKLFEPEAGDSTPCWSMDYVRQTIADYQRLLGDA